VKAEISAVSVMIGLAALMGCGGGGEAPTNGGDGRLRVVATTTVVADLLRAIGGDDIRFESLMGPGVDPHLYAPSAGDVRRTSAAQAVFYNGLHLEGKMSEVLEQMGRRGVPTVAVAECIPEEDLITADGFSGVHDPHVWFDVGLWMRAAACVRDQLGVLDPENAAGYLERGNAYMDELRELDEWVEDRVAEIPPERRVLVTAHDAFSYFGRAYGLEVRGLLGISTAAEAGAADVTELAKFIETRRIPAIFVESSVSPRYVEALQQAVAARGFEVTIGGSLYSDALGEPDGPEATFPGTVRANVNTIVDALIGGAP
jgi:manganese/zinc/iron transport system substrate-binding protein